MKKLFLVLATASTFVACKKSSPATEDCAVTNASITGKYTITSVTYKASSSAAETDMFASMQDCQKDDSYDLKADGSLVIEEETNNCGMPQLPGSPTEWSLDKNNTELIMGANFKIVSFNCKKLVVVETNLITDGDMKTTTYQKN